MNQTLVVVAAAQQGNAAVGTALLKNSMLKRRLLGKPSKQRRKQVKDQGSALVTLAFDLQASITLRIIAFSGILIQPPFEQLPHPLRRNKDRNRLTRSYSRTPHPLN